MLGFGDGSRATIVYETRGPASMPKERVEVTSQGRFARVEDWRVLTSRAWPQLGTSRTIRPERGHAQLLERMLQACRGGARAPIPVEELEEVARATIQAARGSIMTPGEAWAWARRVGPRRASWRVGHELSTRAGLPRLRQPVGAPEGAPTGEGWTVERWRRQVLGPGHWLYRTGEWVASGRAGEVMRRALGAEQRRALLGRAEAALRGTIRGYGHLELRVGQPRDWFGGWPRAHCSRVLSGGPAGRDIKDVWELGRQPHLVDWVRAAAMEGASRWASALAGELASFEVANPWRLGPQWASGQECALRLLRWCWAAAALGGHPAFGSGDFARLTRLVWLHARHIEANLGFARYATPNNHLLAELVGLWAAGHLFPWLLEAPRWRGLAGDLMVREGLGQFHGDGGYCQASHNYHRLGLELLLWWLRCAPARDPRWSEALDAPLERSARYLAAQQAPGGRLPNWGANDGAMLAPWSECDRGDYRPALDALGVQLRGARHTTEPGPWDESLMWWHGPEALGRPAEPWPGAGGAWPRSGLYALRRGAWMATLRCGELEGTASQVDALHVDVWWGDVELAGDGGSYRYHDDGWRGWFQSARAHNTVSVPGARALPVAGRFTPVGRLGARARCDAAREQVRGEHGAWRACGLARHARQVRVGASGVGVEDALDVTRETPITLHWSLAKAQWTIARAGQGGWVALARIGGRVFRVRLQVRGPVCAGAPAIVVGGSRAGAQRWGWRSRRYAELEEAASLVWSVVASRGNVEIKTEFSCASV